MNHVSLVVSHNFCAACLVDKLLVGHGLRSRAGPYYTHMCAIFSQFFCCCKFCLFRGSHTVCSITERQETRLTENGIHPEPNLLSLCGLPLMKACVHPILFVTTSRSRKLGLVVFASRRAMSVRWSLCSP